MAGHFQEFEDEYLETMYEFYEQDENARVRTGVLAERMGVSPASATEMIQRLSSKGYIDYERYKGAKLTVQGLAHGQMMKRRHRLAEVLLARIPFDGNMHETACRLEHAIDDDLEVALTVLLGNPQLDPSGRDIPRQVNISNNGSILLGNHMSNFQPSRRTNLEPFKVCFSPIHSSHYLALLFHSEMKLLHQGKESTSSMGPT